MSDPLKLMISSTVYGVEEVLDRAYTLLTAFGYEVIMSHKGTVPVVSTETAFDSCLAAVDKCDLFLGIIGPKYGSGKIGNDLSITHKEMLRAIELKKPRWFLAHDQVVFARRFLMDLGYPTKVEREALELKKGASTLGDLRVIDMYEDATLEKLPIAERQGNWVQKFDRTDDASVFITAQFSRYQELEQHLKEQFENVAQVKAQIRGTE
ncbi:uncharacterized protein DUF4062 [Paraburkholderia sp. BL23I1N1]|uniref:DUF4062 domain-containing protein n=1 Tax=Paraburkholderia sp. BL23I1N1 TaxID=1938802 RepID=UPI000E76656D|nr:DUF4062 domain-containing protein [Paraburkholderia sp. BL23I1N1]RKE25649.1 uncharacterized protein DUF4062 [Paraburkholderia sp. BL23I1N1]